MFWPTLRLWFKLTYWDKIVPSLIENLFCLDIKRFTWNNAIVVPGLLFVRVNCRGENVKCQHGSHLWKPWSVPSAVKSGSGFSDDLQTTHCVCSRPRLSSYIWATLAFWCQSGNKGSEYNLTRGIDTSVTSSWELRKTSKHLCSPQCCNSSGKSTARVRVTGSLAGPSAHWIIDMSSYKVTRLKLPLYTNVKPIEYYISMFQSIMTFFL